MTPREVKNQKNITLNSEQIQFIRDNHRRIRNKAICAELKITENVLYQNLRLINFVEPEVVFFEHEKLITI